MLFTLIRHTGCPACRSDHAHRPRCQSTCCLPGTFTRCFRSKNAFAETLVRATPLLLIGVGICIAYRGNVINIGGEGQMIMGALVGAYIGVTLTNFPGWLNITLGLLGGVVAGAIWGGIPGVLKAYFNVNEILSTVMMNAIAVQFKNYYLTGSLMDPSQADMASKIPQSATGRDFSITTAVAAYTLA